MARVDISPLNTYTGSSIAEQVGVVPLQESATEGTRGLIQGTEALSNTALETARYGMAQYIASAHLDWRKKSAELEAANPLDPEKYRAQWEAYGKATLDAVPAAFRNEAQINLKSVGEQGYESVYNRTAANTRANAIQTAKETAKTLEGEYLSTAAGALTGKNTPDQVERARTAYTLHLEEMKRLGVVDEQGAGLMADTLVKKAHLEVVEQRALDAYDRAKAQPGAAATEYQPPLSGATVTSPFGMRVHPILGTKAMHEGIDYGAPEGTPVHAIAPGEVVKIGEDSVNGRYITIRHADGKTSTYAHLSSVGDLKTGDAVPDQSAVIGYVGSTGRSTGAHLHLGVRDESGRPIDPSTVLGQPTAATTPRAAADAVLKEIRTDPYYAPLRANTDEQSVDMRVRRAIFDRQIDDRVARAENNDELRNYIDRLSRGLGVDVDGANKRKAQAAQLGDIRGARLWNMVATKGVTLSEFGTLTQADQQRALQGAYQTAQANPKDDAALAQYEIMQRISQQTDALYKADRFAGALRTARGETPQKIDFNAPGWQDQIASRIDLADKLSAREDSPVLPLYADEKTRLARYIANAKPSEQATVTTQVSAALGKYAPYFWQEMGTKGDPNGARLASLALIGKDSPELARDIATGREARLANPHYAPKEDEVARADFDSRIGAAFKELPDARETDLQNILDLYAKQMRDTGNTTGKYDGDAFKAAFRRYYGGDLVDWGGVKMLPPASGVDKSGVRDWVSTLTPYDLGLDGKMPVLAGTGRQVTPEVIAREGKLYGIGNGLYKIEIGGQPLADPNTGKDFVLDYSLWRARNSTDKTLGETDQPGLFEQLRRNLESGQPVTPLGIEKLIYPHLGIRG